MQAAAIPRPRVFISSTIADFHDLREALKFWLEERGYEVLLSEHNDFPVRPDTGSFEACFEAVRQCDHYVLLIGRNRGSWLDQANQLTVTRKEYQVAYESFAANGRPTIATFARNEVMNVLAERRSSGATGGESTLEDPDFTEGFIQEVRREEEAGRAVAGQGDYPRGNWLGTFGNFRELIDGLLVPLGVRGPLLREAILQNLRHELEQNLSRILSKHNDQPFFGQMAIHSIRRSIELTPETVNGQITLARDQVRDISMYLTMFALAPDTLLQESLEQAIQSGALLKYDPVSKSYAPTPLLRKLHQLRDRIALYDRRAANISEQQRAWMEQWYAARASSSASCNVAGSDLMLAYAVYDVQMDIVRLFVHLIRILRGLAAEDGEVRLRPLSPVAEWVEDIEREQATPEDIDRWFRQDHIFLRAMEADISEEENARTRETIRRMVEIAGRDEIERIVRQAFDYLPPDHVDLSVQNIFRAVDEDGEPTGQGDE
jgi:hypothetical protein